MLINKSNFSDKDLLQLIEGNKVLKLDVRLEDVDLLGVIQNIKSNNNYQEKIYISIEDNQRDKKLPRSLPSKKSINFLNESRELGIESITLLGIKNDSGNKSTYFFQIDLREIRLELETIIHEEVVIVIMKHINNSIFSNYRSYHSTDIDSSDLSKKANLTSIQLKQYFLYLLLNGNFVYCDYKQNKSNIRIGNNFIYSVPNITQFIDSLYKEENVKEILITKKNQYSLIRIKRYFPADQKYIDLKQRYSFCDIHSKILHGKESGFYVDEIIKLQNL